MRTLFLLIRAGLLTLGWALMPGLRAESAPVRLEQGEAHYAVLPAGASLAEARVAWAAGRFASVPASGALPMTVAGEDLWIRIVWHNPDARAHAVALEVIDFYEDRTTLYVEGDFAGEWQRHLAGERVLFPEKSLWGREPVLFFVTPARTQFEMWINNENDESQWPLYRLHAPADDYLRARRGHDQWLGFYYGGLLALACYNLFLFGVLRRREILYFLLYVLTFGLGFLLYQGLQFAWLPWLQSPFHNLTMAIFMCISIMALVQFSRNFLVVADYAPAGDRWLVRMAWFFGALAGVFLLYCAAILVDERVWTAFPRFYHGMFPVLSLLTAAAYAVLSVNAAVLLQRGCRQARFYLLGFGAIYVFLVPALVSQFRGTSAVSDMFWVQIGSALEMLFFAFALADKIRIMRDEKNAAEEKAQAESAERSRLERANAEILRQKLLLEELHQQKSEFLSIAAHDLKNPLNAVQGISLLLREDEQLPPEARMPASERRNFLADVADSSHQMLVTIETLLETESLESGRLELRREPHALVGVVEKAWRVLARSAAAKGITASLRVPGDLIVMVDHDRFLRVLENLLSNAIKYSPPGGSILLQAMKGETPGRVIIALHDSGPGFSAADLPQLFGRYRKLSARPTGGESSTGLGLYIVRRLLELQGGTIALVSPPGQSAVFRIEVPAG